MNLLDTRFVQKGKTLREVGQDIIHNPNSYNPYYQLAQGNMKIGFAPTDYSGQLAGQLVQNKLDRPATGYCRLIQ